MVANEKKWLALLQFFDIATNTVIAAGKAVLNYQILMNPYSG